MKLKKYDYVIFAVLFAITIVSVLVPFLFKKSFSEELILIEINGEAYKSLPLDKDVTVPIKLDDKYNLIEIKDHKVHIAEANCPDKLCVKDGYISTPGQILVCLPHKVVVEIKGTNNSNNNEIDESTY